MKKIFGIKYEDFPEDQKKTYLNLIEERKKLEGTREQKDLGQQPMKQSKKRKNKIKSLQKELGKITNKRNSLETKADQILKYIK